MSSEAWVVTCTGCKCAITCFAIDPQLEQDRPNPVHRTPAVVKCPCCGSSYRYAGESIVPWYAPSESNVPAQGATAADGWRSAGGGQYRCSYTTARRRSETKPKADLHDPRLNSVT